MGKLLVASEKADGEGLYHESREGGKTRKGKMGKSLVARSPVVSGHRFREERR